MRDLIFIMCGCGRRLRPKCFNLAREFYRVFLKPLFGCFTSLFSRSTFCTEISDETRAQHQDSKEDAGVGVGDVVANSRRLVSNSRQAGSLQILTTHLCQSSLLQITLWHGR